jgi:hypothetical protein
MSEQTIKDENNYKGLSIVKLDGQYIDFLNGEKMSESYEQYLIYLNPKQKVLFVEENKSNCFVVDTEFLDVIHSKVQQ